MNILTKDYKELIKNVIQKGININIDNIINVITDKFNIDNYINLLKDIDVLSNDIASNILVSSISFLDNEFSNQKKENLKFHSKGFKERSIITCFGFITFKRRIYEYKNKSNTNDNYLIYVDRLLGLPNRDRFDPYVQSLVVESVADNNSMIKIGSQVGAIIDSRINLEESKYRFSISRQTVRNIILKASKRLIDPFLTELNNPDKIYVMADEKYVYNQQEIKDKTMLKSVIIFEDYIPISKKRNKLKNRFVISKIGDNIWSKVLDYIDYVYDEDKLHEIHLLGDGASWIKSGITELKFNKNIKIIYSLDKLHTLQAINHITKDEDIKDILIDNMIHNHKAMFKKTCEMLIENNPERHEVIEEKTNYILSNWKHIQNSYKKCELGCSM